MCRTTEESIWTALVATDPSSLMGMRQVLDDFHNTPIPVTIVGDRLFETSFGGPALIAMAMGDGRPLEELTGEELFGDGNTHREVHGPVIGNRLLVEGNTHEGQLLVTLLDLDTVEGAD